MSFIQDAERLVLRLTPDEKVRLLQSLALDCPVPGPASSPCRRLRGRAVHRADPHPGLGPGTSPQTRPGRGRYPTILSHVAGARSRQCLGYVLAHREEIDWQIQENEAA